MCFNSFKKSASYNARTYILRILSQPISSLLITSNLNEKSVIRNFKKFTQYQGLIKIHNLLIYMHT